VEEQVRKLSQFPDAGVLAQRAQLITRYLDALSQGEWDVVRRLCLPIVRCTSLTSSLLTRTRKIEGIDAYLAYAQAAQARLPGYRLEHRVVFEQRGQIVTRFGCSWLGRDGQRLAIAGSVICSFAGERIAHIGVALNQHRLRALLAQTAAG
jgi:SnoaL-like domain